LNTAVVLMIFARRRGELREMVEDLKEAENERRLESDGVNDAFLENMKSLVVEGGPVDPSFPQGSEPDSALRAGKVSSWKQADAVRNFRELLWFWSEYYSHRGRDRISIEFSSRLHFAEWQDVVSMLCADDGSSASLVHKPVHLPRSPYQCAPRVPDIMDSHVRGV